LNAQDKKYQEYILMLMYRKTLIKGLQKKIKALKQKQERKRQEKYDLKVQEKLRQLKSEGLIQSISSKELKESLIVRLRPFNKASKELVQRTSKPHLQVSFQKNSEGATETISSLIQGLARKWKLKEQSIELKLCKQAQDFIVGDLRGVISFDSENSDIQLYSLQQRENDILYLFYDIKKEEAAVANEGSHCSEQEESSDEDDMVSEQELNDIFTDILGVLMLN